MKYIVRVDVYIKITNSCKTLEKVFNTQKEAVEYINTLGKLKEWESITLAAEPK